MTPREPRTHLAIRWPWCSYARTPKVCTHDSNIVDELHINRCLARRDRLDQIFVVRRTPEQQGSARFNAHS